MTDHFAVLNLPRRPWLNPEQLQERFHQIGARLHPDVAPQDPNEFARLTSAYQVLREPAARLRHLLELEFPDELTKPAAIPAGLRDLFMQIAPVHEGLAAFLRKHTEATSALARALLASERVGWNRTLGAKRAMLEDRLAGVFEQLRRLDASWSSAVQESGGELAALHAELSFLGKWTAQLREAQLQLELLG
ncbi:MAG: J domain-containing protein [Verrucomicrobiota bacterium]|nr:J domain-containing protein [Verrucomicrobiota bacterium]